MVNIFGDRGGGKEDGATGPVGETGPRGPKGSKGDPGSSGIDDLCRWLPKMVLEQFHKDEICCFTLTDPKKDLIVGKGGAYTTWLSHSKVKKNAVAVHPSKRILHISKTHNALMFDKSLYSVEVCISPIPITSNHNYTCVCVTFQVDGEHDQFIFTNWQNGGILATNFRGVSASSKEIRIWGVKNNEKSSYLSIPHETKHTEWITLLVEWSNINDNRGSYILNNKKELRTFNCQDVGFIVSGAMSIGGKLDGSQLLTGAISALEIYVGDKTAEDCVPDKLKHLIVSSQLIIETKHEKHEEPPVKRKKINQSESCLVIT